MPVNVVIKMLMAGEQTVDAYLATLRTACVLAVITTAEDALLSAAGLAHSHPDPSDPWARPRAASLDVDGFAFPARE